MSRASTCCNSSVDRYASGVPMTVATNIVDFFPWGNWETCVEQLDSSNGLGQVPSDKDEDAIFAAPVLPLENRTRRKIHREQML